MIRHAVKIKYIFCMAAILNCRRNDSVTYLYTMGNNILVLVCVAYKLHFIYLITCWHANWDLFKDYSKCSYIYACVKLSGLQNNILSIYRK